MSKPPQQDRTRCAYCGAPATSVDHVPPKNLFPTNRRDLITVPACEEHNGKRSDLDEQFRNYIATHIGDDTPTAQELLQKTVRGLNRNKKLHQWRTELDAYTVEIKSDCFKPMIDWITRGLYWHIYPEYRLPLDITTRIGQLRIGEWLPEFVSDMHKFATGGDQFFCACKRMDDYPTISVWIYIVHRRVVAMAMTDLALQAELDTEL
jgi:hypothetical protein